MKKIAAMALAAAFSTALLGCTEEAPTEETVQEEPKEEEPKAAEVPAYEPTGEHADIKRQAAEGINADNAAETATKLEADLQKQIAGLEAGEGGEAGEE